MLIDNEPAFSQHLLCCLFVFYTLFFDLCCGALSPFSPSPSSMPCYAGTPPALHSHTSTHPRELWKDQNKAKGHNLLSLLYFSPQALFSLTDNGWMLSMRKANPPFLLTFPFYEASSDDQQRIASHPEHSHIHVFFLLNGVFLFHCF